MFQHIKLSVTYLVITCKLYRNIFVWSITITTLTANPCILLYEAMNDGILVQIMLKWIIVFDIVHFSNQHMKWVFSKCPLHQISKCSWMYASLQEEITFTLDMCFIWLYAWCVHASYVAIERAIVFVLDNSLFMSTILTQKRPF
jgi:hypothetical protein